LALLVLVLGCLLMAAGAGYLLLGFDIVMTERGSAMTIGGAVALSGGVVTIGLGFAVLRLTQILRTLEATARSGTTDAVSASTTAGEASVAVGATAAAVVGGATAAGLVAAGSASTDAVPEVPVIDVPSAESAFAGAELLAVQPEGPVAEDGDTAATASEPDGLKDIVEEITAGPSALTVEYAGGSEAESDPSDEAGHREKSVLEDGDEDDMEGDAVASSAPEEGAAASTTPAQPTVLGNYRAGGRTYTMYSNGTVEAKTEDGVERFESMQALRDHLAKT
jgi:hypothetical protein